MTHKVGFVIHPRTGHVKPFTGYRIIKRGISKGQIEAILANGRKVRVYPKAVRRFPLPGGDHGKERH